MKRLILIALLMLPLAACNATARKDAKLLETAKVVNTPEATKLKKKYVKDCLVKYKNYSDQKRAQLCDNAEIVQDIEGGYFVQIKSERIRDDGAKVETVMSKRIEKGE